MNKLRRRISYYKAYLSYFAIATAQFLNPVAAADPASKINRQEWECEEVQEQTRAQEMQEIAGENDEEEMRQIQEAERFIDPNKKINEC